MPDTGFIRLVHVAATLFMTGWLLTALVQVPQHRRLTEDFDEVTHRILVSSNVVRTVGWSARSVLLLMAVHALLSSSNGGL